MFEEKFDPVRLKKYEAGDIIDVNFGLNVGTEFAGAHFAVVIGNNIRKNPNILVVPLSSYADPSEIRKNEVDLLVLPQLNHYRNNPQAKGTRAVVEQIRNINKMRIYYPKRVNDSLGKLSPQQYQMILDKIKNLYL